VQGFDKKHVETPQEKLLANVVNACMEEQLSFIPTEREIARMHTFSQEFQEYMKQLLRTKGKPERKVLEKHEFVYRFNKMAAVFLILFLVGGLSVGALLIFQSKGTMQEAEAPAAAPENMEDMMETVTEEAAPMEEAIEEEVTEAPAEEEADEETGNEPGFAEEVDFAGQRIHLAASQVLPEETEYVKALVSSPLVSRDARSVIVTIGNLYEHPITYYKSMDLEVLIDGAWYLVPSKQMLTEEEQRYLVTLEGGMAQDEELLLEYYTVDYEAEKYRIVTYLDGLILSSQFEFE